MKGKENIQANQGSQKHALSCTNTHTDTHIFTLSSELCPAKLYYKLVMMLYQSQNGIQNKYISIFKVH